MDFISQFEKTLEHTIKQGNFEDSHRLLEGFATTQMPYTLHLYSLINDLRTCRQPFSIPVSGENFRILIYKTGNFILDYIAEQFIVFFQEKGYSLFIFHPSDAETCSKNLFDFIKHGLDAAFFFNNVGLLQKLTDGRNLWETIHVPCFDFLVDHPMYYADSLDYAPKRTTLLCADRTHVDYAKCFYPRIEQCFFFPTGGEAHSAPCFDWKNRPTDVLFIGSYKEHTNIPDTEADAFLCNYLRHHTEETFESAVAAYAGQSHSLKSLTETHRFSETNLTARYRKEILEQIIKSGITVDVYGNGWEASGLLEYPNFRLHAPIPFEDGLALMEQTKIVLNHMAWFKEGSSERIFNAMSRGAVCLTDSSRYLNQILKDNKNCALYALSDASTGAIADCIRTLLSSEESAKAIAESGYLTSQKHTWHSHIAEYLYSRIS